MTLEPIDQGNHLELGEMRKTYFLVLMVHHMLCCTDLLPFIPLCAATVSIRKVQVHSCLLFHAPISHNRWIGSKDAPLGVLSTDILLGVSLYIITNYSVMRQMPSWFEYAQKAPGEFWSKKIGAWASRV